MKIINGSYLRIASVAKETPYGVLNFDSRQTSDVHEQFLDTVDHNTAGLQ